MLTSRLFEDIAARDPEFAAELFAERGTDVLEIAKHVQRDLCIAPPQIGAGLSVQDLVLGDQGEPLRNELSLVSFAIAFLRSWQRSPVQGPLVPADVIVRLDSQDESGEPQVPSRTVTTVEFQVPPGTDSVSIYTPPSWIDGEQHWRYQLGCLIRFILTQHVDFTSIVRSSSWRNDLPAYRPPRSHWYQRVYGLYNEQSAFGDDWLPISEWVEQFLLAILRWPGCRIGEKLKWACGDVESVMSGLRERRATLLNDQGSRSDTLLLPLNPVWEKANATKQSFRICIVQTVLPRVGWFRGDHTLSKPTTRKEHRNHLASALAAVERMLELRETHDRMMGDWTYSCCRSWPSILTMCASTSNVSAAPTRQSS